MWLSYLLSCYLRWLTRMWLVTCTRYFAFPDGGGVFAETLLIANIPAHVSQRIGMMSRGARVERYRLLLNISYSRKPTSCILISELFACPLKYSWCIHLYRSMRPRDLINQPRFKSIKVWNEFSSDYSLDADCNSHRWDPYGLNVNSPSDTKLRHHQCRMNKAILIDHLHRRFWESGRRTPSFLVAVAVATSLEWQNEFYLRVHFITFCCHF